MWRILERLALLDCTCSPFLTTRIGTSHCYAFLTLSCVQREAQAVVASNLARTLYESESLDGLVIAGDFNDFRFAYPASFLASLTRSNSVPDCCGNVPISKVVSIICDRTLAEPMMQAASFIAPAERYSYQPPYKGQIDHLIVSEKLSRKISMLCSLHLF